MEINLWNHELFTTYTTRTICFLEGEQATDQTPDHTKAHAKAEAKAKAQATDHAKDPATDHAKGKGKVVIKTGTMFFVSFTAQHFLWCKEHSFIFYDKKVSLNPNPENFLYGNYFGHL